MVVQNSSQPAALSAGAGAAGQAVRVAAGTTSPRLTAGAHRVAQVFGLLIVQDLPLLVDGLPSFEDPVDGGSLVDDEA